MITNTFECVLATRKEKFVLLCNMSNINNLLLMFQLSMTIVQGSIEHKFVSIDFQVTFF